MPRTFSMVMSEGRLSHNKDKKVLNPKLWSGKTMKEEVRQSILDLAQKFSKELGLSKKDLSEVLIVGGNASWAWHPKSDADITLVLDPNTDMTRKRFKALSKLTSLLNYELAPTVNGIETNFFLALRGLNRPIRNQSVYNITEDLWVQEPSEKEEVDDALVLQKVNEFLEQMRNACESDNYKCHKALLNRLKSYRARGLNSEDGENSFANNVYRQLSRSGELQKLKNHVEELKKAMYHVVTEGTLPERSFVPVIPVLKTELTLEQLEEVPSYGCGKPTNVGLWEECLLNAEVAYEGHPQLIQVSEAINAYYLAKGRWVSKEETHFIRTNTELVREKVIVSESIGVRLAQNIASNHFRKVAETTSSASSRKVLGELARTGNQSRVGDILVECVNGEYGTEMSCGCDHNHGWYPHILESIYRGSDDAVLYADRLDSLADLFALFEEVAEEDQIKVKKEAEEEEKTEKKKRKQRGENPGDKNAVGMVHPYNTIGSTGLNGDEPAFEEDTVPGPNPVAEQRVYRTASSKTCVRCASTKCRCLKPSELDF